MPGFASTIDEIHDIRMHEPERIGKLLKSRSKRPVFDKKSGKTQLMIVACDHPPRGALAVGSDKTAMNDRKDLLLRLQVALSRPGVDGLLATADIAEDLLLLGALEEKLVFASMNRGGLAGSVFEMDDRMTGYDVQGTIDSGFEGAKMLTRIDLQDPSTVATMEHCAQAVSDLNRAKLIALVEPFISNRVDGRIVNDLTPDAVIKSIHITQGFGSSTAYTWMKLPVVAEMERVMAATTLPTLLLGGDPSGPAAETLASWEAALKLPAVCGLVLGRTMLYPPGGDVGKAVDDAVSILR